MKLKSVLGAACALFAGIAGAVCPVTPGRFLINGAEVTDTVTGLVWSRCSVGQTWTGTVCSGNPTLVYHDQALQLAQNAVGWRLPNIKELASLVDRRCDFPAIDSVAFPNTVGGYYTYWSSTPASGENSAWLVSFSEGTFYEFKRYGPYIPVFHGGAGGDFAPPSVAVLLVRANQ